MLNLNKEIVGKVVLKYPHSLSEQTAIATILSDDNFNIDFIESQFIQINGWHYTIVYIFLDLKVYYY